MISEIKENVIVFSGFEDSSRTDLSKSLLISSENTDVVSRIDIFTFVIDFTASIDIFTVGLIEESSLERVLFVVCDVVVNEDNNVFRLETLLDQGMVCMTNIGLMSVVFITI